MELPFNEQIAALATAFSPFVFRAIYKVYPKDLDNLTKMAIVTLVGGFIGVGMFYIDYDFTTPVEAVKVGILSGAAATGIFASIQNVLKPFKSKEIVLEFAPDKEEPLNT